MLFALCIATPAIQGIVHRHARLQLGMIVAVDARQTERDGEEPSRLRRQIKPIGIGTANDRGHLQTPGDAIKLV